MTGLSVNDNIVDDPLQWYNLKMLVKLKWQYKLDEKTISAITLRIH